MDAAGETQVSLTDPDCRAMATTSKQPRVVGYNVQSAVEAKHHLIVAHEVTNLGYDRDPPSMMAHKARDAMAGDTIEAIADKGYYKGEEIVACEQAGIAVGCKRCWQPFRASHSGHWPRCPRCRPRPRSIGCCDRSISCSRRTGAPRVLQV